jgi:methylenetetrahydrofolate dehydrogenase (NADP+)/methenyltetrahydrofolate cyclohydrolase
VSAQLLPGAPVAEALLAETASEVERLRSFGIAPALALVRVGDDPASVVYLRRKAEACAKVGIASIDRVFDEDTSERTVLEAIEELNADRAVHGILVQLPLPAHLSEALVLRCVDPDKDVDGFHPLNAGRLVAGLPGFVPCTPFGIIRMIRHAGIDLAGKHAVVIGRSNIVGRPLANLLSRKAPGLNATVTLAHAASGDLARYLRDADLVVAAVGRPGTITGAMLKPGAVVIDVGINRVADASRASGHRLVGDVDFASASTVAGMITPVPGGVGPLTVAALCRNTVAAAAGEGSFL